MVAETIQALLKRSSVFIIIIGVIVLLVGASGNLGYNTVGITLPDETSRWIVLGIGIVLLIFGLLLEWKRDGADSCPNTVPDHLNPTELRADANHSTYLGRSLKTATSVDMLGYNLKGMLQDLREPIANAIIRGATVRIVLVDIMGASNRIFKEHSRRPQLLISDWVAAYEHVRDIQKMLNSVPKVIGRLEIKLTSWIPSCNLIMIDSHQEKGTVRVGVHSLTFRQPLSDKLGFTLTRKNNQKAFDFFVKGFDVLWEEDSYDWDGKIPRM